MATLTANANANANAIAQATSGAMRELLAFRLGQQEFCIDIMAVREIRGWSQTTPLPHAPAYIQGVVNLRGTVLPVLDLAGHLGLPPTTPTPQHVIIIAEVDRRVVGLLVSAVCDILTVNDNAVQPTPDVASDLARHHLLGLLTVSDRMIGLLRTDQLIPSATFAAEDRDRAA